MPLNLKPCWRDKPDDSYLLVTSSLRCGAQGGGRFGSVLAVWGSVPGLCLLHCWLRLRWLLVVLLGWTGGPLGWTVGAAAVERKWRA